MGCIPLSCGLVDCLGELILLKTISVLTSIRERDKQLIWRLAEVLRNGQQNVQIGDNTNSIDYMYVGNAANAHVLSAERLLDQPDLVSGQVFFITNGEPIYPWTFNRMVWKELGDDGKKSIVQIPRIVALIMATIAELWCSLTGTTTQFTRFNMLFVTGIQWYNIEKVIFSTLERAHS
jgi:sterol-4alpha-carboxylate 3-dehydrogenase (decarboxylating)